MNKKQLNEARKKIKQFKADENIKELEDLVPAIIKELHSEKKYLEIVELFTGLLEAEDPGYYEFETAYAFNECEKIDEAENIYEFLLNFDEDNTSILNNLSNIKKEKGSVEKAYELIDKAYKLCGNKDEIVTRNYDNLTRIMREKQETEATYKAAEESLKKETQWAIDKLNNFLLNVEKDIELINGKIPIPQWKFKVLIGTDQIKADSLRQQWLDKGYIRKTDEKGDFSVRIYEINPYLKKFLKSSTPVQLNKEWFAGIENINPETLENFGYFEILEKINKVNNKYKKYIKRDFDELVFNYFVKNKKAAIILSGSLIELLFTYHCEKKKIKKISFTLGSKTFSKNLYDCTLSDFLNFFESDKNFKKIIIYIGNLSRVYRNFVHPGNEIKNKEILDASKLELCFHSTLEIVKYLLG